VLRSKRLFAPLIVSLAIIAPVSAQASIGHHGPKLPRPGQMIGAEINIGGTFPITASGRLAKPVALASLALPEISLPLPAPSVEIPLRKLFCVEYARMRSGLKIFGDAKYWWARAKALYARMAMPAENAVMVFSGSQRLKKGHVAVVTRIVSSREIRVDQANWQNHGEIDLSVPVRDVSAKNDWSKVRVWNIGSGRYGAHVYAVSGFIAKTAVAQASND
jgi:CHAP domain